MCTQDIHSGGMTYAYDGHGVASTALGLHKWPSDLDIALYWGVHEYLSVSGDWTWVNKSMTREEMPYHPRSSSVLPPGAAGSSPYSIVAHLRVAFVHLRDQVGLGPHGLIRYVFWSVLPSPTKFFLCLTHRRSILELEMAIGMTVSSSPTTRRRPPKPLPSSTARASRTHRWQYLFSTAFHDGWSNSTKPWLVI
jgi:hypothetical protein